MQLKTPSAGRPAICGRPAVHFHMVPSTCRHIISLVFACVAAAHPGHDEVVHHTIQIVPKSDHVEVRVHIAFPPGASLHEREKMDVDGNGQIDADEREQYTDAVAGEADAELSLAIGGAAQRLIPLYAPTLSLEGEHGVKEHPHAVELWHFANVRLEPGETLSVTDATWSELPARFTLLPFDEGLLRVRPEQATPQRSPQTASSHPDRSFAFVAIEEAPARKRSGPRGSKTVR